MLTISSSTNGFGYRADDHASASKPTSLVFSGNTATASGIIEKMDDQDAFSFSTTGGSVTITQDVATIGANLDSTLELRTATGTIIASANPSTSYGATITASLAAGDYTIVTASAGQYGSVGQYTVTVTTSTAPANQAPQAADATFSVAENAAVGTLVGTLNAIDPTARPDAHLRDQTTAVAITRPGQITVQNPALTTRQSAVRADGAGRRRRHAEPFRHGNGHDQLADANDARCWLTPVPLLSIAVGAGRHGHIPIPTARPRRSYAITAGNASGVRHPHATGQITLADNSTLDYETISQYA